MGFKTAVMDEEGCGVRAGVTSASCRQTRAHHVACLLRKGAARETRSRVVRLPAVLRSCCLHQAETAYALIWNVPLSSDRCSNVVLGLPSRCAPGLPPKLALFSTSRVSSLGMRPIHT